MSGECGECEEKKRKLQRKAVIHQAESSSAPPIVDEALRSPGQPLNAATLAFMGSRFGHDFSQVRVHADAKAAESARVVNARAYTVGSHIVFGDGEYSPQSDWGKRLIAHELSHVIQQEGGAGGQCLASSATLRIAPSDDQAEREADRMASDVCFGSDARIIAPHSGHSGAVLRRQVSGNDEKASGDEQETDEPPCSADDQVRLKGIREESQEMIEKARERLGALRGANPKEQPTAEQKIVLTGLYRNFHIGPADVGKHLETILDRLSQMKSHSEDLSPSELLCARSGRSGLCLSSDAYVRHLERGPVMAFCPSFFNLSVFWQRDAIVHEVAHAIDPKVKDWAYTSQRGYRFLPTKVALENADSYARFVLDMRETQSGEERFIPFEFTKHPETFQKCEGWENKLTKALAEAELANFSALRSLSIDELKMARAERLSWFNLVRWEKGECKWNDALVERYITLFKKANTILESTGFQFQCDSEKDCEGGPAQFDGKIMRICQVWDRAVDRPDLRLSFFGWPNAILQAIYAKIEGVAVGAVPGAPREFRTGTAAAIASWMIWEQRNEGKAGASSPNYCLPPPEPIRPAAATPANRKRPRVAKGDRGCPVPELQEKLKVLVKKDLVINGIFGAETEEALIRFQRSEKLIGNEKAGKETTETSNVEKGVADAPTWVRLFQQLPGHHGTPKGEVFTVVGFRKDDDVTMLDFNQQLLPKETDFKGCEVEEVDPGGGKDSCCMGGVCHKSITGGHWTVGDDNTYGPDTVGLILPLVQRYQMMPGRVPCGFGVPQVMVVTRPEGLIEYVRNLQLYLITKDDVICSKINLHDRKGASTKVPSEKENRKKP